MSAPKKLGYGLNTSKKAPARQKFSRPSVFGVEDDDSDTERPVTDDRSAVNNQLSTFSSYQTKKIKELHKEALEEDANIYDYDAVYDNLKQAERQKIQEIKGKAGEGQKARYIEGLLKAAEVRKQDRLRAEEKKIQREREEEGDEFDNKDKFVTAAYKAQQEELRRLEAEEKKREANEDIAKKKNLNGFYRNLLDSSEKTHEAILQASMSKASVASSKAEEIVPKAPIEDLELAKAAVDEGKSIILNDDDQIVDKRQLLSAGLNVVKRPMTSKSSEVGARRKEYEEYQHRRREEEKLKRDGNFSDGKDRERLSRQIESQLLETQRRKEEEERLKEEAMVEKMKKRTTEEVAIDAKSRYLARKKAKTTE